MTVRVLARQARGEPYSIEQFRKRYGLSADEAKDLFSRFGPSRIELDLLMEAKGKLPIERWNKFQRNDL
ncbi:MULTISPECIES: hypothetical protein [unclassified Rhizobium]|uniref:hypothetical protein n=1 Tax=unclassified Rhizobium TaxID=2613769 RepID=UPI0006F46BC6|nr:MULTISPECIES: hypothetical protein [unclassified Rhizobium]KRD31695.1 hypothetical protein ASE37_23410 [Rhizobium sp. Root268]